MTSSDIKTVKVLDDRLAISDQIEYAVIKGGQSVSTQVYQSISASNSAVVFNIQVPSLETILDRRLLWNSQVSIELTYTNNTVNDLKWIDILGYANSGDGITNTPQKICSALSAFPLHQLMSTMNSTINNTTVSIQMNDLLQYILRFNDKRELTRFNSMTPTMFDNYWDYNDAINNVNNPLSSWGNSADNDLVNRGAFVVKFFEDAKLQIPLSGSLGAGDSQKVYMAWECTEPLLLSPWMFANPEHQNSGMYGIQNLNFTFNVGSALKVFRTNCKYAPTPTPNILTLNNVQLNPLGGFSNCNLIFQYLTPHPSDLLPARCVVPWYEMPRYITSQLSSMMPNSTQEFVSQSLQLNQVPDKIILSVRRSMSKQNPNSTDSWLPIIKANIQFNNVVGILSNATKYDLYTMSAKNFSNQSPYEFFGKAFVGSVDNNDPTLTSGSVLILEFGTDINLPEDFYAPGEI